MNILDNINIITVLIACIFILPVLVGLIRPFTCDRVQRSVQSLFNNILLLISVILSIYATRIILSDHENVILLKLYGMFPALQTAVAQKQIWVYALLIFVFLLLIGGVLDLLAIPVYRWTVYPLSKRFSSAIHSMNGFTRQTIGGLWELPRSIWLVLVFSLLLNFYTASFNNPWVSEAADGSAPYQLIQDKVIQPLLNTSAVKNIQVLLNDSFKKAKTEISGIATKQQLTKYFNGVTLDDAIKSDPEMEAEAKKAVGKETNDKRKAFLVYNWISKNITYDNSKAAIIANDPSKVSSGAIVAYHTKTGVCFDYACLYVAMCRAVGVRVRFVTGLGYTGVAWGDHAWNQAYDPKASDWINVDTTFGSSGIDYFDRPDFNADHSDGVVQGEW